MQEAKRGDRVSLNTSKRLYYFQGAGGINLGEGTEEMAVIPETATEQHLKQINHAIKAEHLILGWPEKKAELPDRDSDIKIMLESGRNKIDDWVHGIKMDKNITNQAKTELFEKLMEFEKAGKNRKSVISSAERALSYIGGISQVEDSEQQKIEIKLTSGTEDTKVEQGT